MDFFFFPRSLTQEICPQRPPEQEEQLGKQSSFRKKANCTARQLHCRLMTSGQFLFTSKQHFSQLMLKAGGMEEWDGAQLLALPCLKQQPCPH